MYEITTRGGGGENLFSLSVFRPLLIHFENVAQLLQQLLHILEYPATILYKTILKKKIFHWSEYYDTRVTGNTLLSRSFHCEALGQTQVRYRLTE